MEHDPRFTNALIGIHVAPKGNKKNFNILYVDHLNEIGSQDEVCLFCFHGDIRFSEYYVRLDTLKKHPMFNLFERQTGAFVESALRYWNSLP